MTQGCVLGLKMTPVLWVQWSLRNSKIFSFFGLSSHKSPPETLGFACFVFVFFFLDDMTLRGSQNQWKMKVIMLGTHISSPQPRLGGKTGLVPKNLEPKHVFFLVTILPNNPNPFKWYNSLHFMMWNTFWQPPKVLHHKKEGAEGFRIAF